MKRKVCALLLFSILILALSFSALAQTKLGPKDGAGLPPADLDRIKIGEAAPDFTLENLDGKALSLSDYKGNKLVVLVFYRGYW